MHSGCLNKQLVLHLEYSIQAIQVSPTISISDIHLFFSMQLMVAATLVLLCTRPLDVGVFGQLPWLLPIPAIAIIGREVMHTLRHALLICY